MIRRDIERLIEEVGLAQAGVQRRVASILFTYRCSITNGELWIGRPGSP